jgi:hypothetical protein
VLTAAGMLQLAIVKKNQKTTTTWFKIVVPLAVKVRCLTVFLLGKLSQFEPTCRRSYWTPGTIGL